MTRPKVSFIGEIRAILKNKNLVLYYWLRKRIGKKRALRFSLPICNILTRKEDKQNERERKR